MNALKFKRIKLHFVLTEWCRLQKRHAVKWIAILLSLALLNLSEGCYYLKVKTSNSSSSEQISKLENAGKTIIVHSGDEKWVLINGMVRNDTLLGKLKDYTMPQLHKPIKPNKINRYKHGGINSQQYLLNEVHLYLNNFTYPNDNQASIPVSSISKLEIYDKATGATAASWILGTIGVIVGLELILGIIVMLTKESCPFIYTWDGNSYHFAGEIYSGTIHKPLERNDYLKLPSYANQKSYTLKITNEAKEIQHTNLIELLVIDHPEKVDVLVDKNGKISTIGQPVAPSQVTDQEGRDVTTLLAAKDKQVYQSNPSFDKKPPRDCLNLEFSNKNKAQSAKLVIRAKNSVLLDYVMGQYHDLYGSELSDYMQKQQTRSADEMHKWSLNQGIPLSLYIERNGNWEFVDYYNVVGPMAFKDDVLKVPLKGTESDPLKLKLEFGAFLWEVDYTAIDYSPDAVVATHIVPVKKALNEKHKDISGLLSADDSSYYIQPQRNNQAVVTFDLPKRTDQSRSIILHSKGWYQVLRDSKGAPDLSKLKEFKKPGSFNQFTYEQLEKVQKQALQTK